MLPEMNDKDADIGAVADKVRGDAGLLAETLDGLTSKNETYRYNCYKVLIDIAGTDPAVLYPHWDYFAGHLTSPNSYHKMSTAHLLAGLAAVDTGNRFEAIFDRFYDLLDDRSMVVAYYVAQVSAKIALGKPHLENRILEKLLAIDGTHHAPGRKELIKAGILEAFDELCEATGNRPELLDFVRQQVSSESRKTAKLAKAYLEKWGG